MDDYTAFLKICGDCAGVTFEDITAQDIENQAQSFIDSGELDVKAAPEMIAAAKRYLYKT